MIKSIKQIILLLTNIERREGISIILLSLIMALIDSLSAGLLMNYMSLINGGSLLKDNQNILFIKDILGFKEEVIFISFFSFLVIFFILFSILLKALTSYFQTKYTINLEYSIAKRLITLYLKQPYEWFLSKNSSEIGKTILNEMTELARVSINSLMNLISSTLIIFCMVLLMFYIDFKIASLVIVIYISSYALIFFSTRIISSKVGDKRFESNSKRFLAINEVFGAIKEIKIAGKENSYINRFTVPALQYSKSYTFAKILQQLPRYLLEMITFMGVLASFLYIYKSKGNFTDALPYISLYLYAGFRILPSLQTAFAALTQIRVFAPTTQSIYSDFNELFLTKDLSNNNNLIYPKKSIKLSKVSFQYRESNEFSLNNISLKINAHTSTAIIGATGSGKTTLIDIILGLLDYKKGKLYIDELEINHKNKKNWQECIGYVPQFIYLSDENIAANIAFGIEFNEIDFDKLIEVSKIARIHDFINNKLPEKYFTNIGERGIKLSGGQRQRIGIARALYKDPHVLVLDEATSALDNITENKVMKGIYNLRNKPTILVIAHRLSTIQKCDQIILIKDGKINDIGIYSELKRRNELFNKMIENNE